MISVLCPSRGRPHELLDSAGSLLSQSAHPEGIEILVALDPDDTAGQLAASRVFSRVPQVKVWTAPERFGYQNLHCYMNELATRAGGEWLMMWNDDCRMLTPGWDEVIRGEAPGILWPAVNYAPGINTFPIWPKAWADHLGHVSLDQSADMWWHDIGEMTGMMRKIPVTIHHEHLRGDTTADERDAVATVDTFHTPKMAAARAADAEQIRQLAAS